MSFEPPTNPGAEWSVVGQMLAKPDTIVEVVGTMIEPEDFFSHDCRLIFEKATELYYADRHVDALTVGEELKFPLAQIWSIPDTQVGQRLAGRVQSLRFADTASEHARLVKGVGDKRRLQTLALSAVHAIQDGSLSAEEVGDMLATEAAKVTTGSLKRGEVLDWMRVGSDYAKHLRQARLARSLGMEIGVYTGFKFLDQMTRGLAPTELWMVAGEPGVGKSAISWEAGEGFAKRQMTKPPDKRIGALILSLEMGEIPSSARLATSLTGIDSGRLREGDVTEREIEEIVKSWNRLDGLPLYFNFASNFKLTQLRALIVEAIRRHNVGFIILDHFRMVDPDRRINNANQEDEHKARFLKESIAKELNVAVMCLAHTVKIPTENSDGRPRLSHLRGSGQVAAHCDIVSFMYRPIMYATENEVLEGVVDEHDAEMIYAKNRNGALGTSPFHFDPARMKVRDK